MKKNELIKCKVIGFQDYGMFVSCGDYQGLVHISEISEQYVSNITDIFELNDLVTLKVLDIDEEDKKLKLSYKRNHKIHRRILKNVRIVKGFNKLSNNLDEWVNIKLEEYNYEKNNNEK